VSLSKLLPAIVVGVAVVTLSSCAKDAHVLKTEVADPIEAVHDISRNAILNATYVLLTPAVRYKLSAANQNFRIRMTNGSFEFPRPSAVAPYGKVRILPEFTAYGDLAGNDKEEAVVVLSIGSGDDSRLEAAVLSGSGNNVTHIASYLLGHADILSLTVRNREIHAKVKHALPGDPGLRTTDFRFVVKDEK
jgi:hypothetical protein